jgi:AraC-like DNA-binding protein
VSTGDGFDVRALAQTFRDGHVIRPHAHPWGQLTYARSGVMQVVTDGRVWFVPPTRAIWIPPRATHEIGIRGEVAFRTLYIAPERAGSVLRAVEALRVNTLLQELIVHIATIGMLDPRRADHDRLAGVLLDLIAQARGDDLWLPLPTDPRALRLAERLREQPAEKADLESLASNMGASLRTLQRTFMQETGLTIEQWRQKARLVHSSAELASGASVTAAAIGCGYDSTSAYIAAFRAQFGVTPGRFARGERA